MLQIETLLGVQNVNEIAAVEGVGESPSFNVRRYARPNRSDFLQAKRRAAGTSLGRRQLESKEKLI